jgi:CheY-like chemotaxis protein
MSSMNSEIDPGSTPHPDSLSRATSELNNALQIISVAASLIDNAWRGSDRSEEYLAILRASVVRAEHVAAEFVRQTGGPGERMLMHPQLAAAAKEPSAVSETPEQSILLVDDDVTALMLVKRILTEAGYRVVAAQSGFECLDLFRNSPHAYDLVILDFTMPLLTGEETFHRLREIWPDVQVVLCAGFIQQEKLTRLMASGLAGLMRKPLAPDEIVDHVRATLESLKYSRAGADPSGVSTAI